MGTQSEIQDYVKRPGRYSNIDGTNEMLFGAMYLAGVLLDYLQRILPADSILTRNGHGFVFMEVVLLAVFGLSWWGSKAIKKYITYPRSGYVAYRWDLEFDRSGILRLLVFGAGVSAALAFVVFYGLRHNAVSLLRIGILILCEAPYAGFVFVSRDHPWKWFVALFMALGLAAIAFTVPGSSLDQLRPITLFLGLTWLASGGLTSYLYIRGTHPPIGVEN